jgi:coenzyme F420-reducing hydrogenase delta subunit
LSRIGLEAERLQMFQMSAAMAGEFVLVAQQMTELVARLGPNPLRDGADELQEAKDDHS